MPKLLVTLFFMLPAFTCLRSQDITRGFELVMPNYKEANSLYNNIQYIDDRRGDTTMIGLVYVGVLRNNPARLVFKTPLATGLNKVLSAFIDSTAKPGTLVFQLHRFGFVETEGTRYCSIAASIYNNANGVYMLLDEKDTTLVIRESDVLTAVNKQAGTVIRDFIGKNLHNDGANAPAYNIREVRRIDSIKKQNIPLYKNSTYTDGIYLNYQSFAAQVPDKNAVVKMDRDGTVSSVKTTDSAGKTVKVHSKDMYALVYNGQPFIATQYGYYTLLKSSDGDFYFTGDIKVAASQGDVRGAQIAFGLIGAALASGGNQETYTMMLNYKNGTFVHMRKIAKPDNP